MDDRTPFNKLGPKAEVACLDHLERRESNPSITESLQITKINDKEVERNKKYKKQAE